MLLKPFCWCTSSKSWKLNTILDHIIATGPLIFNWQLGFFVIGFSQPRRSQPPPAILSDFGQQHYKIGKWMKPDIKNWLNWQHMEDLYLQQHSSGGRCTCAQCGELRACKSSCFCGERGATELVVTASVGVVARLQAHRPTHDHHALPQNASRWLTSKWRRRVFWGITSSLLSFFVRIKCPDIS